LYALICPLLQFEIQHHVSTPNIEHLLNESHYFGGSMKAIGPSNNIEKMNGSLKVLLSLYWLGVFIFSARFISQVFKLFKLRFTSREAIVHNTRVFIHQKIAQPFSFFSWIFVPLDKNLNRPLIIQHEKIHAHQLHSVDNMILEIISIFLWFHPFVYLIKKSLTGIHEYHADYQVIQKNSTPGEYLNELFKIKKSYFFTSFVNSFYGKVLKKRVKMMVRDKSPKVNRVLYLLAIPVLALFSFSFSLTTGEQTNVPSIKPIPESNISRISSGYGIRKHPITGEMKMHHAVDIVAKKGTPVLATADGKVIKKEFKGNGKGHGRYILIQHDQVYSTLYTQLSGFNVKLNQHVKQGDIIGYVGSSGISTGPHLHYEVWKNGEKVDPEVYFTQSR
jgi:hypothetical protein